MSLIETLVEQARAEYRDLGYPTLPLANYDFPETQVLETVAGPVRYSVYGDPGATNLVYTSMSFGNEVDSPNNQIRLQTQQDALSEGYCVVGVQEVIHGSSKNRTIKDYGRRLIGLAESMTGTDQRVRFYGFSMGADVTSEAAYTAAFDENGSNVAVDGIGVWEPARSTDRKWSNLLKDFGNSGKDLFDNVVASNNSAMLEYYGIDPNGDPEVERKKFDGRITRQVALSSARHLLANKRLAEQLANDQTFKQLQEIVLKISPAIMNVVVGRASRSTVTPEDFLQKFGRRSATFTIEGDHSICDDMAISAVMLGKTLGF